MRAQPRWILVALLALAGLLLLLVRKLGPNEVSAAAEASTRESVERLPETSPSLDAASQALAREIAPESTEDDLESYPESVETPASGSASLVVTLLGGNRPIGPGVVQVDPPGGGGAQTRTVDAETGRALFEKLSPGVCAVRFYDLPPGWLPPRASLRTDVEGARYVYVQIHPGANQCDVGLEPAVRVFGQVLGPDGERLENLRVRFTPFDEASARTSLRSVELRVDSGRYEGELHEGVWLAEIPWFSNRKDARGRELPLAIFAPPVTQLRMLHAGSSAEIDFVCERGPGAIEGRVVDENGLPFQELRLLATRVAMIADADSGSRIEWHQRTSLAVTEEDGTFEFPGLATGKYLVSIDFGEYLVIARPGVNVVGEPPAPKSVEIGPGGGKSRIEIRVRRSHPIHVTGRIETESAAESSPAVFLQSKVPGESGFARWSIDAHDWRFDFYVEAAARDSVLEIDYRGKKSTYPLTLSPDAEATPLVLRFPK